MTHQRRVITTLLDINDMPGRLSVRRVRSRCRRFIRIAGAIDQAEGTPDLVEAAEHLVHAGCLLQIGTPRADEAASDLAAATQRLLDRVEAAESTTPAAA